MAANRTQSALAKKANILNKSISKHAQDETNYGIVELPGGIKGGIARLIEAKFGEFQTGNNKGEPFFHARGTVVSPQSIKIADGTDYPVYGLQTSITMPLCETRNQAGITTSADENVARVLNAMRALGGEDFTEGVETVEDLENLCEQLIDKAPYFRFSTSTSKPTERNPEVRVFQNWHGSKGLEDYQEGEGPSDTEDDSGEAEESTPKKSAKQTLSTKNGKSKPTSDSSKKSKDEDDDDEGSGQLDEFQDIDSLVKRANSGKDKEATSRLTEMAVEAGYTEKEVSKAASWEDVAEMISSPKKSKDDDDDEEEEDDDDKEETKDSDEPELEQVWNYYPVDPKTKKKSKSPVECEVIEVSKKNKTVSLKSLDDDDKTYSKVSWDDIEPTS